MNAYESGSRSGSPSRHASRSLPSIKLGVDQTSNITAAVSANINGSSGSRSRSADSVSMLIRIPLVESFESDKETEVDFSNPGTNEEGRRDVQMHDSVPDDTRARGKDETKISGFIRGSRIGASDGTGTATGGGVSGGVSGGGNGGVAVTRIGVARERARVRPKSHSASTSTAPF